jgi:peptidoglycan/LPS O-acetylase OafA/YrhL
VATTDSPARPSGSRIPSLDGLRGIAILTVVLGHGAYALSALPSALITFGGNGQLGVSIFFVLSGYLIFNLSAREYEKTGGFNWKQFFFRRVLRIFPCFYFFIAVILLLKCFGALNLTVPMIFGAASFSLNYLHLWYHWNSGTDYFVIGHYWTLCLEEQFYLTWPILMLLFARRQLRSVLLIIMVLAPIFRIATYFLMPGSRGQMAMMFHTGFDSIAAGVLLGELMLQPRYKAWLQNVAGRRLILGSAVVFPLIVSPLLAEHLRGGYSNLIGKSLDLVCICIVITAAVSFPGTFLFRFLNWRPLVFLGILSYSLYVWNNLFLNSGGHWLVNRFPLNFLCALGMALASHFLVERPFLKLKDRLHKSTLPCPQNVKQSYA